MIMKNQQLLITCRLDVELDHVGLLAQRRFKRRYGILRRIG
jgi:hypothetical protein